MSSTPSPDGAGALISVPGLPNLRDVGGWATPTGPVATGLAYRSVAPVDLAPESTALLAGLGLRTVYDLRAEHERVQRPDEVPDGASYVVADVLADSQQAAPAQVQDLLDRPELASELLGRGQARAWFVDAYRDLVALPSATSAYHVLFTGLADVDRRPVLYHCTGGKDRTGWATAVLLMLLGVAEDDVRREYLLTNEHLMPRLEPIFERFAASGGDPGLLRPLFGVEEVYLDTALAEMTSRYGDVEAYVSRGLGLGADGVDALRTAFLGGASDGAGR